MKIKNTQWKYLKAQTNKNSSRTNDDDVDDDDDALFSVDENARDVIGIWRELFVAGRRNFTTELAAAAAAAAAQF